MKHCKWSKIDLEQIHLSINHCKNDIAVCEEQIKKCSMASLSIYEAKKFAFKAQSNHMEYDGTYSNDKY